MSRNRARFITSPPVTTRRLVAHQPTLDKAVDPRGFAAEQPEDYQVGDLVMGNGIGSTFEPNLVLSASEEDASWHLPVIDIDDIPVRVVPSSTEGHFHLYIDKPMRFDHYMGILNALVEAGVVEPGYRDATHARGVGALRLHERKHPRPPF